MKKLFTLCLSVLLLAVLTVPALADVIWEPDDSFYWAHYDECQRVGADYEARTDAALCESPDSDVRRGTLSAGTVARVYYRWEDWGCVDGGWVELAQLRRLYGEDDFIAAHGDEIVEEDGAVSRAENGTIVLWTFPGSGEVASVIDSAAFAWAEDDPSYYAVWTDGDGSAWGRVGYYYLARGWICLDDPGADDLPRTAPVYADAADEPTLAEDDSRAPTTGMAVTLLVILVAAAAVVLMIPLLRKK